MDPMFEAISLSDCPICSGVPCISEEGGWAITVECLDCGSHTTAYYDKPEDRQKAAEQAAYTWNLGKVVVTGPGE